MRAFSVSCSVLLISWPAFLVVPARSNNVHDKLTISRGSDDVLTTAEPLLIFLADEAIHKYLCGWAENFRSFPRSYWADASDYGDGQVFWVCRPLRACVFRGSLYTPNEAGASSHERQHCVRELTNMHFEFVSSSDLRPALAGHLTQCMPDLI